MSFPIVGSFSADLVTKINAERTINLYEIFDPSGKKDKYLAPWPGKKNFESFVRGGTMRAAFVFKEFVYFVVADTIYRMDSSLVITIIGDQILATLVGHVGIAANEKQVIFVDNNKAVLWDTSTSTLTDPVVLPAGVIPLDVTFMDGYFILVSSGVNTQNQFLISNLNDGITWAAADFALTNARPTVLSACSVLKRRLFLFGETKSEIWLDAGAADFPFRRDNNLLLEHGVLARSSITEGFDRMFYLSNDEDGVGGVMMVIGTSPQKVSSREVDETIQTFTQPEDAEGFVFKINGQIFYQLNFTTDDRTFIYNANTDRWHEAQMIDGSRDIATAHSYFFNKHYVGSYNTNILYELSENFYSNQIEDNNIEKIKRIRIARVFSTPTYNRIRIDRLWVDMLQGIGLSKTKGLSYFPFPPFPQSAADVDPVIFLSISEDGGISYHNFGSAPIGPSGQSLVRTMWHKLGARRDAIIKLETTTSLPIYILGAAIDYEGSPE